MAVTTGPQDVLDAARAARRILSDALSPSEVRGSQEEWRQALAELQAVIDVAAAAQDEAIVRLAAIEPEVLDDGEVIETHRAPGHVALDAPALVSWTLNLSAVQAERRMRAAVRMAADGPEGTDTATGLGGLHAAMGEGRLDAYRASVVATELEAAPPEVAASVITGLEEHFSVEDATKLRRRVRRVLARISPDLLRQRAARARSECRLERWAGEPGVDTWHGTFPTEDAAKAWAAIDALAQQYVTDGVSVSIDRARAKALTDLVARHSTSRSRSSAPSQPAGAPPVRHTPPPRMRGPRPTPPRSSLTRRPWSPRSVPLATSSRSPGCDPVSPFSSPVAGSISTPGRHSQRSSRGTAPPARATRSPGLCWTPTGRCPLTRTGPGRRSRRS